MKYIDSIHTWINCFNLIDEAPEGSSEPEPESKSEPSSEPEKEPGKYWLFILKI